MKFSKINYASDRELIIERNVFTKRIKRWGAWGLPPLLFMAYGWCRFRSVTDATYTAALPGDGWGTIAWIFDIYDNINRRGLSLIFSDFYLSDSIGGGLNTPGSPTNFFWKAYYWFVSCFFAPAGVYDTTGYLAFVLIGLSGYGLGRKLNLHPLLAAGMGLVLCSCENFDLRVTGHLTLATYFMPIVLVAIAIETGRSPSLLRALGLALVTWFNFVINEYYGYFGVFVALGVLLSFWLPLAVKRSHLKTLGVYAGAASVVFLLLMAATYPTLVGSRLNKSHADTSASMEHSKAELKLYAVKKPWKIFRAEEPWLAPITPAFAANTQRTPEYTHHVGPLPFYAIVALLLMLGWDLKRGRTWRPQHALTLALLIAMAVGMSLAAHPKYDLALSKLTAAYAGMFRVGVRALVYSQIAAVALLFVCLGELLRRTPPGKMKGLLALVFLGIAILEVADVRAQRPIFSTLHPSYMRPLEVYKTLAHQPRGYTLELPFHYPARHAPERDYSYFESRIIHKQPIVNGMSFKLHRASLDFAGLGQRINTVTPEVVAALREAGVRYLVAHEEPRYQFGHLKERADLTLIDDQQNVALYDLQPDKPYDALWLRDNFFSPERKVYAIPPAKWLQGSTSAPAAHTVASMDHQVQTVSLGEIWLEKGVYRLTISAEQQPPASERAPMARVTMSGGGVWTTVPEDLFASAPYSAEFTMDRLTFIEPRLQFLTTGTFVFKHLVVERRK